MNKVIEKTEIHYIKVFVVIVGNLINITDYLPDKFTLDECYKYVKKNFGEHMIYVFDDMGLSGKIYRCGNYNEGEWQEYASTMVWA